MGKDIMLDSNNDLLIKNGDFVIGESTEQEVARIIVLSKGGLKEDPILGPNLISKIKSREDLQGIERAIKLNVERDGKDWDKIKPYIKTK
jgi:hypothetical protein